MSSLKNAIRILRCFDEQPELRLSDISRRLEMSKANTYRLLTMLGEEGLVHHAPNSPKYRLGLELFELGQLAVKGFHLHRARPRMTELNKLTQETVLLGVLDGWNVVYVEGIESQRALRVTPGPSGPTRIYRAATGKALLAWLPPSQIDQVIHRALESEADEFDADELRDSLAEVRRKGYASNERQTHVRAVSAPVHDESGAVIAALTVAAPAQRMSRQKAQQVATLVVRVANQLSGEVAIPELHERPIRRLPQSNSDVGVPDGADRTFMADRRQADARPSLA